MTERRTSTEDTTSFPWMNPALATSFWSLFGNATRSAEPLARCAARCQLEMSSLVGTRLKAWSAIPETIGRCRTPMDLFQAQMYFWQDAGRDYTATSQHLMAALQGAIPGASGAAGSERIDPRDYITFPEPKSDTATEDRRHPGEGRRAA